MRLSVRKHKLLAAISALVALVALVVAWNLAAPVRGRLAAHYDIARGQYRELTYGLPVEWIVEYRDLLKERYGVDSRAVTGCTVSPGLISYVTGYNEVSSAAANKRFGHDIFKECREEAQKRWDERTPMEKWFPSAPKKTESVDCFRSFTRKNSAYEVVKFCGRPDEELCSGLYCFFWHLDDGSTVRLGTGSLDTIGDLIVTDKSGNQESLLHDSWQMNLPKASEEVMRTPKPR